MHLLLPSFLSSFVMLPAGRKEVIMGKHLTLDDRMSIQCFLKERMPTSAIAKRLCKAQSTIVREILKHRIFIDRHNVSTMQTKNACTKRFKCKISGKCKKPSCEAIHYKNCKYCGGCNDYCEDFEEEKCQDYITFLVCNGCPKKPRCPLSKYVYDAKEAQKAYSQTLSESRQGPSVTGAELEQLNEVLTERLKKGQSVNSIYATDADILNVSSRTAYKYIHENLLDVKPYQLQRMTRFKIRKKAGPPIKVDRSCYVGRTYSDFKAFIEKNPDVNVVEMDSICGKQNERPAILSLLFRNCDLQLFFYRSDNTARSVTNIFNWFRTALSDEEYEKLFPVILTDRGSEFTDPVPIEVELSTGVIQTKVFYCDPMNSNQKSKCERNHELFRYIIPKGNSFTVLSPQKTELIMNNVNSYPRKRLGGKSPIAVFKSIYGEAITEKLGLKELSPKDVSLKPSLIQ